MTENLLLGLFQGTTPAADAIAQLRQLGVADGKVTVMSGIPYESQILGRPRVRGGLAPITLLGAILGVLGALLLSVGIFLLYPLVQGGQPIVPVPPSLIVLFEITMLGMMGITFLGFLVVNRLPAFGRPAYDLRITAGEIGVLASVDEGLASRAEQIYRDSGAHDVRTLDGGRQTNKVAWGLFAATVTVAVIVAAGISLLFFYDVIKIPFPSQMIDQVSVAAEQGPRLAAPAEAVPVQGPALIAGQPASAPLPATDDSRQRGSVLFATNCALCHGQDGKGKGPIGKYFLPQPADLTSISVQELPDDVLFLVLTQGRGIMPSLAENLTPAERWDTINYVHSFK